MSETLVRRPRMIRWDPLTVGIDIGGTKVLAGVVENVVECRNWARQHREYGFWGGESEEERAAAGFRVDMPVGRVARYPRGNGSPVAPRESRIA